MPPFIRNAFPYVALALLAAAVVWATSFRSLQEADFAFANGDQVKTIDPHKATGTPENRVINGLFEGLLRSLPDPELAKTATPGRNVPLKLFPGVAASLPEVSDDGKTYVYTIREGAKWSNERQITADDFVFSWQRLLHPETGSEYAYQLHYAVGAEAYNLTKLKPKDVVEVELYDRPDPAQQYPRGTIVRGELVKIHAPYTLPAKASDDDKAKWKRLHVYEVSVTNREERWNKQFPKAGTYFFSQEAADAAEFFKDAAITACHHVLPDFESTVAIRATGERRLEVKLNSPTAFFNELVAFYPLYPVCRECIEQHGSPNWTREENIVSNGAFKLQMFRMRDRIRMVKSDTYWGRDTVKLGVVDALAMKGETTMLNMFVHGKVDWINTVPNTVIPELKKRDDFYSAPMLTTYFYRINVAKKGLEDVRVRRALNAAINKQAIVESVTRAGQIAATSYVPPGLAGYQSSLCGKYDLAAAKQLLADAGFPNGQGLPKIEIMYNTSDDHRAIAEVIQQDWSKLGIQCELRNLEWASFLDTLTNTRYGVARSAWVGDYPDPNTFLDMFVTNGPNNQTNWSNKDYDALIEEAKKQAGQLRLATLTKAERILMDELPIIPIYFYVSKNMVSPRVKGFTSTIQDIHPLELLSVEPHAR